MFASTDKKLQQQRGKLFQAGNLREQMQRSSLGGRGGLQVTKWGGSTIGQGFGSAESGEGAFDPPDQRSGRTSTHMCVSEQ